mmetsp:Transcript_71954/g.112660  ORF Transcript_71954/g.112660 Transcript_71954/m.112660 type:complete len:383 (-) Transcript_71954:143-1291(-)
MSSRVCKDRKGKRLPKLAEEIEKHGFEQTVVTMLERRGWTPSSQSQYEASMLQEAEQYFQDNAADIDLSVSLTAEFAFSGSFTAPALHWFLSWGVDTINFVKHHSVTEKVLNGLDDKGNSALFYCHSEHFQAGWSFHRSSMLALLDDTRFLALDFPLIPAYGGGVTPLSLPARKVENIVKRSQACKRLNAAKLKKTINSTRDGVSILHMVCDEVLVEGVPPASLIKAIRSHSQFRLINHIADFDNSRGGTGNSRTHQIRKESCVAAALRKTHTAKRAKLVEALLERHPSRDHSLDFRLKPGKSLAGMAQDSLDGMKQEKFSGFRARMISMMAKRAMQDTRHASKQAKKASGVVYSVLKTITKSRGKRMRKKTKKRLRTKTSA